MADRKTTASRDPVEAAKFAEKLRMAGRPSVMRTASGEPNVQPSLWMRVMASVHSLIDPLVANVNNMNAGRVFDPNGYGNVGSGFGGRMQSENIDQYTTEASTGKPGKTGVMGKKPIK